MISRSADADKRTVPQARTRLARQAVVDAARTEFLARGYGATTIDAVSARSGVPAATVYRLFTSKLGILKALLDVSIVGDDDRVAMPQRPQVRSLLADPDPEGRLASFVAIAAQVNARTAPIYRILVSAAGSDPEAAALLDDLAQQRQQGQAHVARSLARDHALGPGLGAKDAIDVIHALVSPEVYRLLVIERGWPSQRYERWLTSLLIEQLLLPNTLSGAAKQSGRHGKPRAGRGRPRSPGGEP